MRTSSLSLLTLLVAASCATSGAPAPGGAAATDAAGAPQTARVVRGSSNLITSAEIEEAGNDINNAYDLVQRLRPSMMRFRNQTAGTTSSGEVIGPVAYVDDVRLGALDLLRTVMRASVREIRFLSPTDATTRWGTGHSNGVVQVLTKR